MISKYITFDNTIAAVTEIMGKAEMTDASDVELPGDPAVACVSITLDSNDAATLMKALLQDLLDSKLMGLIDNSLAEYEIPASSLVSFAGNAFIAQATVLDVQYTMNVYMDAEGTMTCIREDMTMTADDQTAAMGIGIWTTTLDNGSQTSASLVVSLGDAELYNVDATYATTDDGVNAKELCELAASMNGQEMLYFGTTTDRVTSEAPASDNEFVIRFTQDGESYAIGSTTTLVTELNGEDFTMTIVEKPYVDLSGERIDLATETCVIASGDPMESIASDDAIRMSEMTEDEFTTWVSNMAAAADAEEQAFLKVAPDSVVAYLESLTAEPTVEETVAQ